jgi:hypothetical protein
MSTLNKLIGRGLVIAGSNPWSLADTLFWAEALRAYFRLPMYTFAKPRKTEFYPKSRPTTISQGPLPQIGPQSHSEVRDKTQVQELSTRGTGRVLLDKVIHIHRVRGGSIIPQDKSTPYITLDYLPKNFEYSPSADFKDLGIIGRNTGLYQYGGSEDTLNMEVSWLAKDTSPGDAENLVITKCRKLEALTKSDGYSPPFAIYIQWGVGGGLRKPLFENHFFLVEKAPYVVKQFISSRQYRSSPLLKYGNNLHPAYATQTLTLKRVSLNQLTRADYGI